MSVFFSVINNTSSIIDDSRVSTETTYSSYGIELKIQELLAQMLVFDYKEYPANIRSGSQKVFLTPNSNSGLLLVLREGVKMALGDDYTKVDDFHISFAADVPEDLNVFILVLKTGSQTNGNLNKDTEFIHTQGVPSLVWTINHNLGNQFPSVVVVDSSNNILEAEVKYDDLENCTITLKTSSSGKCICRI